MPKLVYVLLGAIIMTMLLSLVFNFLGIEFASYGNYLLWFVALAIFYAILPSGNDSLF